MNASFTASHEAISKELLMNLKDEKMLRIPAKTENLDRVLSFVDEQLEVADCPVKTQIQIDVAVEEIFVNIANYAYSPGDGEAMISFWIENDPPEVVIVFRDTGFSFNPTEREDPDVTLSLEERKIGGLGIFMAKRSMDHMTYRRENGENILTLRKKLYP